MNIAHIVSSTAVFPLPAHHGRYDWALRLALAQAAAGHTVVVYAGPGSGKGLDSLQWRSAGYDFGSKTLNDTAAIKTALSTDEHDIFHSHLDFSHYFLADLTTKPIVSTGHWFPTEKMAHAAQFNTQKNVVAVPVTAYMQQAYQSIDIPSAEPIYHGIDLELFNVEPIKRTDRFLFVGRIAPHKGVHLAIDYALRAGVPLDIIGKINDEDQLYWQELLPKVDGKQIKYVGPKPPEKVARFFKTAKAFLFPVTQAEAFGQVTIESQACGTPVIITDVGASRELVQNGRTGFVVKTPQEFVNAIRHVGDIDPAACRAHAEKFDSKAMVAQYEALYQRLLQST